MHVKIMFERYYLKSKYAMRCSNDADFQNIKH